MPTYPKYLYSRSQAGYVAETLAQQGFPQSKSFQSPWRSLCIAIATLIFVANSCMAWKAVALDLLSSPELPSPEDIPEEVARTEIITEARSSINGNLVSAVEYAEEQTSLRTTPYPPTAPQKFRDLVLLLQFRRLLRPFLP